MSRLTLKLLGAFQVLRDGKPLTGFDSDKTRALLIYLAVESRQAHRRETLAGLLWPDVLEASARQSLSQALSNLRKLLNINEAEPPYLLATRDTVQFNPDADYELDIDMLNQPISEAANSLDAFLPGFTLPDAEGFEEWLLLQREAIQRKRIEGLEEQVKALLAASDYPKAISLAQRLLQVDPWREGAHLLLMQAYALNGQRGEALLQFEKCKKILNDELGIAPAAQTQALAERIRAGELEPTPLTQTAATVQRQPIVPPAPSRILALPVALTPFIGRQQELDELQGLLSNPDVRLITLTGSGGMGKTRLAIQAAGESNRAFTAGAAFISLSNVNTVDHLAPAIAATLGLPPDNQTDPTVPLLDFLREKGLLLILDNFEHLLALEGSLAFLDNLLQTAPQVKLLVTSREALGTTGEWVCHVAGLGKDAYTLFALSARRVHAVLHPERDDPAILRICHTLDGMPLGIELAASWTRLLSCQEIADEIEQNLGFLETQTRDVPERHRSMTTVFEYSWRLLTEHERQVMMALSAFRGGFTRDAAKQVAEANLLDLSSLVAKSMIRRTTLGRYDLHNVVRLNARRHLAESGRTADVARRHLKHFTELAESAAPALLGAEQANWLQKLALELDNFRAALDWANQLTQDEFGTERITSALRMMVALQNYWRVHGHLSEARERLSKLMLLGSAIAATNATLWAKVLGSAGMLAVWQDDLAAARALLEESQRAWLNLGFGHEQSLGLVLLGLGEIASANSDFHRARQIYEQSFQRFEAAGDKWGMSESLVGMARHALAEDQDGQRIVHNQHLLERSLALKRDLRDTRGIAWVLSWLSTIVHENREPKRARELLLECLKIQEELGDKLGIARTLNRLAEGYRQERDYAPATTYYADSLQRYRDLGSSRGVAMVLHNLGHVTLAQGQREGARVQFQESLQLYQRLNDREGIALALAGLGGVRTAAGQPRQAILHFAAAETALRSINYFFEATDLLEYQRNLAHAHAQLNEAEFSSAWAAGCAMPLEQTVQAALGYGTLGN